MRIGRHTQVSPKKLKGGMGYMADVTHPPPPKSAIGLKSQKLDVF